MKFLKGILTKIPASQTTINILKRRGECALFGLHQMEKERQIYIAMNTDAVKQDIAFGGGERLAAIQHLSACDSDSTEIFANTMRANAKQFVEIDNDSYSFSKKVRDLIDSDAQLKQQCQNFRDAS